MARDTLKCSETHGARHPTVEGRCLLNERWIREVAATADAELRAHRIALTYSRLAQHLDDLIHREESVGNLLKSRQSVTDEGSNANWFHFATWGTLTVSQNIANDRPVQRLNSGLAMPLRRVLTPAVLNVKASGGQQVGRALAWGQLLIFVSAAVALRAFSRHIADETPIDAQSFLTDHRENLIEELSTWDGKPAFKPDRHLAPIGRAFQLFERARAVADARSKARLILGANLLLTEVEQDLADPALSIVVDLVPRRLAGAVDWRLAKLAERFRGVPTHFSYLVLPFLHANERKALDAAWSRFMTDQVLVMALPTETLRLGRDIPPLHRDRPYFPPSLRDLDNTAGSDVALLPDLKEVARHVKSLDRTVGNGRGSAARDWRRWDERMNWAVTLLRSRQQDQTLFWRPYADADAGRIVAGDLPRRAGDASALEIQPPIDGSTFADADLESRAGRR